MLTEHVGKTPFPLPTHRRANPKSYDIAELNSKTRKSAGSRSTVKFQGVVGRGGRKGLLGNWDQQGLGFYPVGSGASVTEELLELCASSQGQEKLPGQTRKLSHTRKLVI